jgi:hypothetical protein
MVHCERHPRRVAASIARELRERRLLLFRNGWLVGQFCRSVVVLLVGRIIIGDRSDGCA